MADRFPSLDEFDAGQTEVQGQPALGAIDSQDPTSLEDRERAVLGDDAELFASNTEQNATFLDTASDGLIGGGASTTNGDFESSFPAVDTSNEAVAPGGSITGSTLPYRAPTNYGDDFETEPEVLREWRERRDKQIQDRDEILASKKAETVKAAQQDIDEFYENYNNRKDKQISQTRKEAEEFLKNREDTTSGGTSWERIAKLVDLSGKGTAGGAAGSGKSKMRELLISLRKDEKAPGASGF